MCKRSGSILAAAVAGVLCLTAPAPAQEAPPAPPQIRYLEGHAGPVYAVAATRDGHCLLSAGVDGTIRVWDRETGLPVRTIAAGSANILSLAVTPDGRRFASGGLQGTVNIFDVPGRNPLATIPNVPGLSALAAVSPDGGLVATGDDAPVLRLWNTANAQHLRDFAGLTAPVTGMAFLGDAQLIVASSADGALRGWRVADAVATGLIQTAPVTGLSVFSHENPEEGHLLAAAGEDGTLRVFRWPPVPPQNLAGHSNMVTAASFSPGGKLVATGGADQLVNLYDPETAGVVRALAGQQGTVTSLAFSADDALVATGSDTGALKFWNAADGADRFAVAGHAGAIHALAFHPKQKQIASAGADGTVRIWSLPAAPRPLAGHSMPVASVSVTADGKTAASVGSDKSVLLWSFADGKQIKAFPNQPQPLTKAALSPDGKRLAVGDSLGDLRLWDLTGDAPPQLLGAHAGGVSGLAFDPKEALLYSSGLDGAVKVWKLPAAAPTVLPEHAAPVHAVALSHDGKFVVSAATDGTLRIIDRATGKQRQEIKASAAAVTGLAVSADNSLIVASDAAGTVTLIDGAQGALLSRVAGHAGAVQAIAFHPESREFATAGADGTIRTWQTPAAAPVLAGHTKPVRSLSVSTDGTQVLTASEDGSARVWNAKEGKPAATVLKGEAAVRSSAWSADGKQVATGDDSGTIRLLGPADGASAGTLSAHQGAVSALAYRPENDLLASTGADGLLKLWKLPIVPPRQLAKYASAVKAVAASGDGALAVASDGEKTLQVFDLAGNKETATIKGLAGNATSVAVSPDKTLVAAATDAGTIEVYPAAGGEATFRVDGHPSGATGVAFHPREKQLASVGVDGTLRVWDIAAASQPPVEPSMVIKASEGVLSGVAWSPDGTGLLTGAADKGVKLWNASNGEAVRDFPGNTDAVSSVAFSRDGARVASSGVDKSVRIWTTADAAVVATLAHPAAVRSTALSPDGARIVTAGDDSIVRVWDVASQQVLQIFAEHTGPVRTVAIARDGQDVLSGGEDASVRRSTIAASAVVSAHEGGAHSVTFLPSGEGLLTAGADKRVVQFDLAGKIVREFAGCTMPVRKVAVRSDAAQVSAICDDKHVYQWQAADAQLLRKIPVAADLTALAYTPDGNRLAVGGADNQLRTFDPQTGQLLERVEFPAAVTSLAPFPDNISLGVGLADNSAVVRQLAFRQLFAGHTGAVNTVAWTADGKSLLSGGADNSVRHWSTETGMLVRTLSGHTQPVTSLVSTFDSARAISASVDKTIRVWTLADGAQAASIPTTAVVQRLALGDDDTRLAGVGDDGVARVWPLFANKKGAAGRELQRFAGHAAAARAVAVSADGETIVSGSDDKTVRLSPVSALRVVTADAARVHDLALLPDGSHFVTGGDDMTVKLWDREGNLVRSFAGSAAPVAHVAVSGDGKQIAAGGDPLFAQTNVLVWNAADAALVQNIATPAAVTALEFGPQGRVAAAGADKRLRVYSAIDAKLLQDVATPAALSDVRFVPGTPALLAAAADNNNYVFDYSLRKLLVGHEGAVTGLAYLPGGEQLLTAGADGTARLWNLADEEVVGNLVGGKTGITALVVSGDGKRAIAGRADKTVDVWELDEPQPELKAAATFTLPAPAVSLAADQSASRIAVGGGDNLIRLWDLDTGTEVEQLAGHTGPVLAVALSADGATLFSGSADVTARRWIPSIVGAVTAHEGAVGAVQFSADGRQIFTAGDDKLVKSWATIGLEPRRSYTGADAPLTSLAISPDGKLLAGVGEEPLVRLWAADQPEPVLTQEMPSPMSIVLFGAAGRKLIVAGEDNIVRNYGVLQAGGKPALELTHEGHGHTAAVSGLALAADDRSLFSVGADKTVNRWYAASHEPLFSTNEPQGPVYGLAFSADGTLLAAGGADKSVRIWDSLTGKLTHSLSGHTRAVSGVAFHNTGNELASSSHDGTIRLWSLADVVPVDPTAEKPDAAAAAPDAAEKPDEKKPGPPDRSPKPGLLASTFANNSFSGATAYEVVSQIDLDWGQEAVNLSRVWTGTITFPAAGKVTLSAETSDKPNNTLQVVVGGQVVIDGLDPQSAAAGRRGVLAVDEGERRELPIRIEFSQSGGPASLRLLWSWEGKEAEVIPAAAFKHTPVFAGDLLHTIETDDRLNTLAYTPDGSAIVAAGKPVGRALLPVVADATGRTARPAVADPQSRLPRWDWWNRANGRPSATLNAGLGHNQSIYALAYNPANSRIASIDYSGKLFIWNPNGQMVYHQQLPVAAGYALTYTPDGTEIIVGTHDARVLRVLVPPPVR